MLISSLAIAAISEVPPYALWITEAATDHLDLQVSNLHVLLLVCKVKHCRSTTICLIDFDSTDGKGGVVEYQGKSINNFPKQSK